MGAQRSTSELERWVVGPTLVAGGRFVWGFTGEQFALPPAAEVLQAVRRAEPTGRSVRLSGADPLNLTGIVLPGDRVPARSTEWFDLPV